MPPVILWFRRNLRLTDNAALIAAAASGRPIVPVYVVDELDAGGASRWWLQGSLESLDRALQALGGRLVIRRGVPNAVLAELVTATGADGVFFSRRYEPAARRQERALEDELDERVDVHAVHDSLLWPPAEVRRIGGAPFKVFTPFFRAASALGPPERPRPVPAGTKFTTAGAETPRPAALGLRDFKPDWAEGLRAAWQPGEASGLARLDALEENVASYPHRRDLPSVDGTSRLSPYLHFGEVSPRQVWHAIHLAAAEAGGHRGAEALARQLYWRDFSSHLLLHFPSLPSEPLRPEFVHFPWRDDEAAFRAWCRGTTGYPIVDAGMRQLWQTGWMHNRVRMVVGSFLVKHLLLPWQRGADWFLDTLVDADLGNNSASWQWVAGCGTDAAPYFRIFNPTLQGKKFDPDGDYVTRYVPELRRLPKHLVHEPWLADRNTQKSAGVLIGEDYPAPIVDHKAARQRALAAYQSLRGKIAGGAPR